MNLAFPFLLAPGYWSARNRVRRRERGDGLRSALFGSMGLGAILSLFGLSFWVTWRLLDYEEFGEYLLRLGLSWVFLTLLSFLAFSGLVATLSTFFLSEDLRLLLAAPVSRERMFYARYSHTVLQAGWMAVALLLPVLGGVGYARCASSAYYLAILAVVIPFVAIPVSGGCALTLLLVNVFPARRARDVLMLVGACFGIGVVVVLRLMRPERLLDPESLPDVAAFFATFRAPLGPLAPSYWAGETLFAALRGEWDGLHLGALWTTAAGTLLLTRWAYSRWYFSGWSKAQEARKARFTQLLAVDGLARLLPGSTGGRALLVKDLKLFLRDTTQWSQLLLLVALALVYLYNFRALDLSRVPWMSGLLKDLYTFLNLGLAAFVLSAVAVRFVFPSVSQEGAAFWLVRSSPLSMRAFLWAKFWACWLPLWLATEALGLSANALLGVRPELQVLTFVGLALMTLALVGLAAGLGAQYPRFGAENVTQVAGSYGGVVFMVLAVLYILASCLLLAFPTASYLWHRFHHLPLSTSSIAAMAAGGAGMVGLSAAVFWFPMRRGIRALERLGR